MRWLCPCRQPGSPSGGMTDYIDSLNPFVGYEDASYAAWEIEYPALVEMDPG